MTDGLQTAAETTSTQQGEDAPVGVLVGVDGSEPSVHALRWSAFLAHSMRVALTAVIAWELPGYSWGIEGWAGFPNDWDPAANAQAVLEGAIAAAFGSTAPAHLTTSVREGIAARVLLDACATSTMLVVGSRGHGGFAGLLLGSVSSACAAHATVPVLVVHGSTPAPPTVV
jgi:nucleotide-binding universal stress UspA family protein